MTRECSRGGSDAADESWATVSQAHDVYHIHTDASEDDRGGPDEKIVEEVESDDGGTSVTLPESTISVGEWNINGLGDYKQLELLSVTAALEIDVLAVCETHLEHPEQLVHWARAVESDAAGSQYRWYGRAAVRASRSERGRGSGGVGLLVRRDWADRCVSLPECDHPCLHFIRLDPRDLPFSLFIGVAYAVPIGSARAGRNSDLLAELEERSAQYSALGMVLVLGDFNVHIACMPSTVLNGSFGGLASFDEPATVLDRRSVDTDGMGDPDEAPTRGADFITRMDAAGLVVLNGLCAVGDGSKAEATHSTRSVIDLILVSSDHWQLMDSVRVEPRGRDQVASDHELIVTAVRYAPVVVPEANAAIASAVPDGVSYLIRGTRYNTATRGNDEHFSEFEAQCTAVLPALTAAWNEQSDAGCPVEVEAAWAEFTSRVHSIAGATLGERRQRQPRSLVAHAQRRPGDAALRAWKSDRRAIWAQLRNLPPSEAGREPILRGQLRAIGRHIRNHLQTALRSAQEREISKVQSLRRCQMREHWRELKRIGNLLPPPPTVPAVVLDAASVEHSDPATVRMEWREAWARLAQHVDDDPRYDAGFEAELSEQLAQSELREAERPRRAPLTDAQRSAAAELNGAIELKEVAASIKRLQRGKAEGSDGIAAEVLKEGGEKMAECLHQLCRIMFTRGEVPMEWLRGVLVPLHKDGDTRAPLNYRPITLLSIAGKVYTGVLQARLIQWTEAHGIIVPEQGGFRPQRGCPEQVFALTELIKTRRLQGQRTYTCFIDIRKAYDTVWQAGLKAKLLQCGMHGRMYAAICSLSEGCETTIRLGPQLGYSDFFPIETGVRQGCILSPVLYSLWINDLAVLLKQQDACGVPLAEGRLAVLLYADDIVLLAESEAQLSWLMARVHEYAHRWRFEVNHSKCGLMCFQPSGAELPASELRIGERTVPWVAVCKYLGVELHAGVPFRQFRARMLASATRAANAVSGMGMLSGKLPVPLGDQVYKAMVRPLLEYCSEVWSVAPWPDAERVQTSMAKRILQCPGRTSDEAARGELGWMRMDARYQLARMLFWGKLQLMTADSPARLVFEASQAAHAWSLAGDQQLSQAAADEGWEPAYAAPTRYGLVPWCAQLAVDVAQLGAFIQQCWRTPELIAQQGLKKWREEVRGAVVQREQHRWWRAVTASPMLRTYATLKAGPASLRRELYLTVSHGGWNDQRLAGRRALTRLRCGFNELRINTGRWDRLPIDHRICEVCGDAVETESHFLLDCELIADSRTALYGAIDSMVAVAQARGARGNAFSMATLAPAERLCILTGGQHAALKTAKIELRVLSKILAEIAEWVAARKERLAPSDATHSH